jgi:maltose alpha-D-glucosyltransferase/alpha-amylase
MPGTPVLCYGDEIGMGENLRLPERDAIRTPMQWSMTANAGYSDAEGRALVRPVVDEGPFSYEHVNVTDQRRDPDSLLLWFERMLHTLRECEEIGVGDHHVISVRPAHVLAHRAQASSGSVVFLHNLSNAAARVQLPVQRDGHGKPVEVFSNREYAEPDLENLEIDGYGYRWIRLRRNHSRW